MNDMLEQCTEMMRQMGGMMNSMGGHMMGGMMGGNSMAGGMMAGAMGLASPWYWLGWVLVVAALVGAVAAFIWTIRMVSAKGPQAETPTAILQRRFAGGEITPKQFDAMSNFLSKG